MDEATCAVALEMRLLPLTVTEAPRSPNAFYDYSNPFVSRG